MTIKMMFHRSIFIMFLLASSASLNAYITKIVGLKHPVSGKVVFICYDNHTLGTVDENNAQADLFLNKVITPCYKKLFISGSKEKLGIFCESMNFYKFFDQKQSIDFNALSLDQSYKLYELLNRDQTTWISWQLPFRFIQRFVSKSLPYKNHIFLKSIDPRLPLEYFRNYIERLQNKDVLTMPEKNLSLADINGLVEKVNTELILQLFQLILDNPNNYIKDIQPIKDVIDEVFNKIKTQQQRLNTILASSYAKQQAIVSSIVSRFNNESIQIGYKEFLAEKKDLNTKICQQFVDLVNDDEFFSDLVDLVTFINVVMPGGPKYSIVLQGSAHAKKLKKYLKKAGFEIIKDEKPFDVDDDSTDIAPDVLNVAPVGGDIEFSAIKKNVKGQFLKIPKHIGGKSKSASQSDLLERR